MRTATADTRKRLRAARGKGTRAAWARAHDVRLIDVSDCLRERPMSARRENRLRAALGLPLIRHELVELAENQYIATHTPRRKKMRRAADMWPEEAAYADKEARDAGYTSWGAKQVAELRQRMALDLLYGLSVVNCDCSLIPEQE